MRRILILLIMVVGLGWLALPMSEAEASSCLTRDNLIALPPGSLAPVLCNQYGQLYAVGVRSDGTQVAMQAPAAPYWQPVRYESPFLYRTAGSAGLTCTTSNSPTTYPIGQPTPVACNQYGQLLIEVSGEVTATTIATQTVAGLPGGPATGTIRYVTDGTDATDCTVGGGAALVTCIFDGTTWVNLGSGGVTGWPTSSANKVITWANSLANAARIGDGTTPICLYTDATLGPQVRPCTDANVLTIIPANFTWSLWDIEGAAAVETVDPDAGTQKGKWTYGAAYRPTKSVWFGAGALSTDGTQCAAPAEATPLASGVKLWTIICADNDGSRMHGSVVMPDNWDGGTVTFESTAVQTAASAGVIEYQAAAQCKGDTEALVATASYGSEVVWTDTLTGSSGVNRATSGAVTPSGTCAAGDFLAFYIDIGAANTTTAMATLHTFGFKMYYTETSRSQ